MVKEERKRMNLSPEQQIVYNQMYTNMLKQPTAMEKRYGKNWKQIIHTISINNSKKQAPAHRPNNNGNDGCPCCN